jgi:hypothetical protein
MDRYHGSARPDSGLDDALNRDLSQRQRIHCARAARKRLRDKRRQWIIGVGATPSTTPMWTSRQGWLDEVAVWTETKAGQSELDHSKLRPALLLRVAHAVAEQADHASGRHCAATNATIARAAHCSERTVTTVRRILREAGYAVEVRRGTGSALTPRSRRRPSVWHLVSRKQPVDDAAVCDLPPSLCDRRSPYVGRTSPSTRTRLPPRRSSTPKTGTLRTPRPLGVQKMAAAIIAGSLGLGSGHPGHICDALTRSDLELSAWTAPQILNALNADMRRMGWCWPNQIENPGAFLAMRLRRLPVRPSERPLLTPKSVVLAAEPSATPPASAASRAAAKALFRDSERRRRTQRSLRR